MSVGLRAEEFRWTRRSSSARWNCYSELVHLPSGARQGDPSYRWWIGRWREERPGRAL